MKTVKALVAAMSLVYLSGCATARVNKTLSTFLGKGENAVISAYGAPTSVYQAPSGKIMTYYMSGGQTHTPVYGIYSGNLMGVQTQNNDCKIDFILNSIGIVEQFRWAGRGC